MSRSHHCILLVLAYLVIWTTAFSSSSLERSALTVVEPETGCQVVLVGCFHGSTTSANDVKEAFDDKATDGAVLELCTDRCADLLKPAPEEKKVWWKGLTRRVAQTREKQGLSTATTMAVLGGFSGIAQSSSGMTPGIEFRTALDIAKDRRLDVILADQPVDITLQRLSQLPSVALDVIMNQRFLEEARSLQRAVFGTKTRHLSLLSFLTRSNESSGDILKYLLLPTSAFIALQLLMGEQGRPDAAADVAPVLDILLILLSYLVITLPATRVILSERDDYLAGGIRTACKGKKRIVAVLGFLHVNGVADRLTSTQENSEDLRKT